MSDGGGDGVPEGWPPGIEVSGRYCRYRTAVEEVGACTGYFWRWPEARKRTRPDA